VARALDYAHRRVDEAGRPLQLVHGDVTPQNILLSVEGEVKLTDFGIARALGTLAPGSRIRGGTPGYVAPELARQDPDHRADIYSLGMTLCAALTGRTPNESELDPRALRAERPDATAGLCAIIERATAPRPENRFLSAGDLERALALELARRCPGFTPSALAAIVAEHVRGQRVAQVEGNQTLTSITASEVHSAVELSAARPVPQSEPARPLRTQTHVSTETEPRGWLRHVLLLVAALLIVAASAAVAVVRSMPAETPPSPRFAAPLPAVAPPMTAPAPEPEHAKPTPPPPPAVTHALSRSSHARAAHAKPDPGYVSVSSTPWGAVYIDGRRMAEETPVYRLPLSPGPHRVHIVYGDHASSAVQRVIVHSGQTRTLGFDK
jgi:eukaryotic-like serine/threonine-protein kinase